MLCRYRAYDKKLLLFIEIDASRAKFESYHTDSVNKIDKYIEHYQWRQRRPHYETGWHKRDVVAVA
jgi:hypothetical protein